MDFKRFLSQSILLIALLLVANSRADFNKIDENAGFSLFGDEGEDDNNSPQPPEPTPTTTVKAQPVSTTTKAPAVTTAAAAPRIVKECTSGSDDGRCFEIDLDDTPSYDTAVKSCAKRGLELALVTSSAENDLVSDMLKKNNIMNAFIQGQDVKKEGEFVSLSSDALTFTNWLHKPMPVANRDKNCAAISFDGAWIDMNCDQGVAFVCANPLKAKK